MLSLLTLLHRLLSSSIFKKACQWSLSPSKKAQVYREDSGLLTHFSRMTLTRPLPLQRRTVHRLSIKGCRLASGGTHLSNLISNSNVLKARTFQNKIFKTNLFLVYAFKYATCRLPPEMSGILPHDTRFSDARTSSSVRYSGFC